jgi:hypothetical protein
VLGGHIHLPWLSTHRNGTRPIGILQAGTAVSRRVRREAPNSVNLLRIAPRPSPIVIERWDYVGSGEGGRFSLAVHERWAMADSSNTQGAASGA